MISFDPPLLEGRLERRYKRFLADVRLVDGRSVTAHCANPGSMKTCMLEGGRVWLSRSDNPKRKLAHSWEIAEVQGQLIVVNTARGNQLVADALQRGAIVELADDGEVRREVSYGERSRIDFALDGDGGRTWVEVKSVTMGDGPTSVMFPDSVTTRGTRHLEELMRIRDGGERAVLLFCVCRSGVSSVSPADSIDPVYGETLRRAAAAGVELLAYSTDISTRGLRLAERLPIELSAQ